MGNCCKSQSSSTVWAGDDWKPLIKEEKKAKMLGRGNNEQKLIASSSFSSSSGGGGGGTKREVKLKISKKELATLLELVDTHGLSLEQVLGELIGGDNNEYQMTAGWKRCRTTSWRPVLQSIPENN